MNTIDIEKMTAKDAYKYARYVIGGRFEAGENAIAKDAMWVYWYKNLTGVDLNKKKISQ